MRVPVVDAKTSSWNYKVLLGQGVTKQVGSEMSSEKLVLPFVFTTLGGPAYIGGLLVPLVSILKFCAQILGAPLIEAARETRWYLGFSSAVSAAALIVICVLTADIGPFWLAFVFIVTACLLGSSAGVGGLAFQDVLGRALVKKHRANLLFITGALSGVLVIATTLVTMYFGSGQPPETAQIQLIWVGLAMLVLSAIAVGAIREKPEHADSDEAFSQEQRRYLTDLFANMRRVLRLHWFRRFLVARTLFLSVELVMPFFAIHAATFHGDSALSLGMFIVASSIGLVLGGLVWPLVSKTSIRPVMVASALLALVATLIALITHIFPALRTALSYAMTFVVLSFASQGVIVGRTVYLVGAASDDERPYCVSVNNIAAGVIGLLMAAAAGAVSHVRGAIEGLLLLAAVNVVAAVFVRWLPDVQPPDDPEDAQAGMAEERRRS